MFSVMATNENRNWTLFLNAACQMQMKENPNFSRLPVNRSSNFIFRYRSSMTVLQSQVTVIKT